MAKSAADLRSTVANLVMYDGPRAAEYAPDEWHIMVNLQIRGYAICADSPILAPLTLAHMPPDLRL